MSSRSSVVTCKTSPSLTPSGTWTTNIGQWLAAGCSATPPASSLLSSAHSGSISCSCSCISSKGAPWSPREDGLPPFPDAAAAASACFRCATCSQASLSAAAPSSAAVALLATSSSSSSDQHGRPCEAAASAAAPPWLPSACGGGSPCVSILIVWTSFARARASATCCRVPRGAKGSAVSAAGGSSTASSAMMKRGPR